ncbi:E3 ubiquitin- ligase UBR3-like, partial [Paramuricea clavata]
MQQGMYTLKPQFWETHFDPVHALLRAFNRREFQSAMDRYTTHLRQHNSSYVTSAWPPFRPLTPVPKSFNGVFRLLHCKKLHQMLYLILYKATSNVTPLSETVIYLAVHLITLAVQSSATCFQMLPCPYRPSLSDVGDTGCVIVTKCLHFLDQHGSSVKDLHANEDFSEINETLLTDLMYDPEMSLDVKTISVQDISLILGHTLHYRMEPSLFATLLPYMNSVLSSALNNSCSQSEKEGQLQHIQHLLETLPAYRYNLARRLIAYLIRYIEREQISMKNISLICDDSQPLELTMLFKYLIKFHEKLFRVYPRTNGLPRDISMLEFPSNNLVDNIRHEPRILTESRSMLNFYGQVSLEDIQGSVTSSSSLISSGSSTNCLVEEFMEVTHASREIAVCLLQKYEQNLQIAVNIYLENCSSCSEVSSISCMPMDVDDAQGIAQAPVVKMSSHCCNMESETSNCDLTKCSGERPATPEDLNNSILSLLVKLKTVLLMSVASPVSPRCAGVAVVNDGVKKIEKLLELICRLSSSNVEAVGRLETRKCSLSPTDDIDDPLAKQEEKKKRAKEYRQKVLNQLKNQQQKFFDSYCNQGTSSDVDGELRCSRSSVELFDCAICNQNVPSTEQQPIGYVAFLQSGTVLKHRKRSDTSKSSNEGPSSSEPTNESFCCGSVYSARRKFLLTYFEK